MNTWLYLAGLRTGKASAQPGHRNPGPVSFRPLDTVTPPATDPSRINRPATPPDTPLPPDTTQAVDRDHGAESAYRGGTTGLKHTKSAPRRFGAMSGPATVGSVARWDTEWADRYPVTCDWRGSSALGRASAKRPTGTVSIRRVVVSSQRHAAPSRHSVPSWSRTGAVKPGGETHRYAPRLRHCLTLFLVSPCTYLPDVTPGARPASPQSRARWTGWVLGGPRPGCLPPGRR